MRAWGEKAGEAERETDGWVSERVRGAREEVKGVEGVVEGVGVLGRVLK